MSLIVKVLILSALTACGLASRPPSGDVIPSELELRSQQGSTTNTSRKNINICCLEKHEKKDANGRKRAHFTVEAYDHKVGPREGLTERCSLTALAEWSLMTHRQQKKECQRRFWNSKQYYRLTAGDDEDELKDLNGKKAATQATMSNCKKKLEDKYNMTVGSAKETLQKAKQAHEDGLSSTLDLQAKDNKRLEELKKQIQALEEKMATYAVQIVQLEEKFNQSRNDFDREKQRALDEYTASQTGADAEFDTKMARFTESTKAIEQRKAERMKHVGNVTDAKMPQTCQENDALGCCCSVVVGPSYAVAVMVDKTFIDWTRCIKPRKYTWNSAKYPKTCEPWGKCPECQELVCGAHKCPAAEEPEEEEGDDDDYQ